MSAELHALIHSLSKAERRFLSLFADFGAGRSFDSTLELMEAILELPAWDEALLLKSLRKQSLIDHLSSHKTRLLNLVLRSQRLHRSEKSVGSELRGLMEDIAFLMGKGQPRMAQKRLEKAKALAIHYEDHGTMLQLITWEQRLFIQTGTGSERAFFERLELEERHHLDRLSLQQSLLRQHTRIRSLLRTVGRARKPEEQEAFRAILMDPCLRQPPPEDAFYASTLFLQIRGTYHLAMGESESAWLNFDLLMHRWEAHSDQIGHHSELYLSSLNNYLSSCLSDKKYHSHFLAKVKTARDVHDVQPETRVKMERVAYAQELSFRMNFRTLEDSAAFLEELQAWLDSVKGTLEGAWQLFFYNNLSLYHFIFSSFRKANHWLKKILDYKGTDARQDIRDFARVFQLILQYELGNLDLQEYLLRSASRSLKREDKVYAMESAILEWTKAMQKLSHFPGDRERLEPFKVLLGKLEPLADAATGRLPLGLNEVTIWAKSKVAGVSIGDYFQGKG